ncbi:MAG TPA: hypothetical protein VMT71_12025 [Syntrophorhabdales bacterium]|nr:hypothetical protein [Syntrophorhabdales bacterium]
MERISNGGNVMDDIQRLGIVLRHLIEHNEGHAEDYARWIELARSNHLTRVAELITEANEQMKKGSEALRSALNQLGVMPAEDEEHHHH